MTHFKIPICIKQYINIILHNPLFCTLCVFFFFKHAEPAATMTKKVFAQFLVITRWISSYNGMKRYFLIIITAKQFSVFDLSRTPVSFL